MENNPNKLNKVIVFFMLAFFNIFYSFFILYESYLLSFQLVLIKTHLIYYTKQESAQKKGLDKSQPLNPSPLSKLLIFEGL